MVLHRALRHAVLAGILLRNPVDGVSRPKARHYEIRTLSIEETRRLFDATKDHRLYASWVLLATTGLRLGEALGLKWEDIDFEIGKFSMRRGLQREKGVGFVLVEPKTSKSRRSVYLAPGTIAALREHRQLQTKERRAAGDMWHEKFDLVFSPRLASRCRMARSAGGSTRS